MIKLENMEVMEWEALIRGILNPMNSWKLIAVYTDISAPLYFWKEFDTYKVSTVANSCSTMRKIHELYLQKAKLLQPSCFPGNIKLRRLI